MHSTRSLLLFLAMLILAALPGSLPASAAASQATFVGMDTSAQGNWKGLYGTDGYVIANDSQKLPSYATFAVENQTNYTWASGTTDVRALQSGVNSGRIASTWYSNTSFDFDLNLTDGNFHKVALYAVDWDNFEGGRIESIQIADASTGTVLNTQTISKFNNGIYLTWNISGHVKIYVAYAGGGNPVISGMFFTGASTAKFAGTDTTTQGNWKGVYGSDGYVIANDSQKLPSYATFAVQNQTNYTWASGTTDVRALESGANAGRIASTWFTNNTAFNFDLNLTDGNSHQVGLYAVDWDNFEGGRIESVQIADANSGAVLDTEKISKFNNGIYLIWSISGHVTITVAYAGGGNPVISGVFFTGASTAKFAATDASTQGNWKSAYGSDGYVIANDSQKLPSYATFAVQNQTNYTWSSGTTDVRALQSGANSGRIASTWYSNTSFNFDLNLTDGNSHQIALYALDWDNFQGGRIETVQIADAATGTVLDTEKISAFTNGIYLLWTVSGHVKITVAYAGGGNAVTSGIFFGSGAAGNTSTNSVPPATGSSTPTAPAQGTIAVTPSPFSFGSINVGSHVTQTFTVSNSGTGAVTFSSVTVAGAGLTATGVSTGTSLNPGQSATLTVVYSPASAVALAGGVTFVSNASNSNVVLSLTGTGLQAPSSPSTINAVSFLGTDTTTQGAWKGIGKFNTSPPSSSFTYGKEGDILPDTEACDACNPFPAYVSFGPNGVSHSTPGNLGSHPYSTHASAAMVQGPPSVMGPEPSNTGNTSYYQCNYTYSNPAIPWAPMVAWTPAVDTREISSWYTCGGQSSFYLEFSFGNSTHNFEVYVVDDQSGGTLLRSEELQVLDGDTNAVLYDSGSFTNFTGGVYYKWSVTGHVKVKVINTSTNGTVAVINGAFFN